VKSQNTVFDPNQFLESQHKGNVDTSYVLPDEGEYMAQTTDKITVRSGLIEKGDRAGQPWASIELQWEIQDENLKQKMNMDKVFVRQGIMLDLDANNQIDWGTNKNMRLKRLIDATGLNSQKNFSLNMLKFQPGYVKVEHRKIEGMDDLMAEVTRVVNISKAAR